MYAFYLYNPRGQRNPVDIDITEVTGQRCTELHYGDAHVWPHLGILNFYERDDETAELVRDHYVALNEEGALWLMLHTPADAVVYWSKGPTDATCF